MPERGTHKQGDLKSFINFLSELLRRQCLVLRAAHAKFCVQPLCFPNVEEDEDEGCRVGGGVVLNVDRRGGGGH